jgi:hypothetical protein
LIERAYDALFDQNEGFRAALKESGTRPLIHSIGKKNKKATILTEKELISNLIRLREKLN